MLTRIFADNFKCLVNFDLPLDELVLVLGINGSGKSSVLDVTHGLRELLSGRARITDAFPASTLTRWETRPEQTFELTVGIDGEDLTYRLEVEHERHTRRARIQLERLSSRTGLLFESVRGDVTLYRDDHSVGPSYSVDWTESALARVAPRPDNRRLTRFLQVIQGVVISAIYPPGMKAEAAEEAVVLARDGTNFAAWYRNAAQERQDRVPRYQASLQQVIDGFGGLRLERTSAEVRTLLATLPPKLELRFDELSDGERALMALYALVHLAPLGKECILFLDEPDNYVALPELQPWLMSVKEACGDSIGQVVLTSHHPELIDYLGVDSGVWLKRTNGGPTQVAKISPPLEGALKLSELIARGWQP